MMIKAIFAWLYFAVVQIVARAAMIVGWFLLIVPCIQRAWVAVDQIYIPEWQRSVGIPAKQIFIWRWRWLNEIWGNDEDGVVSGLRGNVEYNPQATRWKAYLWCAWRNSANNLRFIFRWKGGPLFRQEWFDYVIAFKKTCPFVTLTKQRWYFQAGWNSSGFPVISGGVV